MWEKLSGFEQMVMDFVWANPGCTADDCRQDLAEASRPVKEFIGAVLR
jgi:predicted transcriptional regulator